MEREQLVEKLLIGYKDLCLKLLLDGGSEASSNSEREEEEYYRQSLELIPEECRVEDIIGFCQKLQKIRGVGWITGVFLSAMLNNVFEKEEKITLGLIPNVGRYCGAPSYVGYRHARGILIVNCELGWYTGKKMTGGEIIVNSNVGYYTGEEMKGGKIWVKCNAGRYTGNKMKAGIIEIEGDADYAGGKRGLGLYPGGCGGIGEGKTGGEIVIKGRMIYIDTCSTW